MLLLLPSLKVILKRFRFSPPLPLLHNKPIRIRPPMQSMVSLLLAASFAKEKSIGGHTPIGQRRRDRRPSQSNVVINPRTESEKGSH